MSGNPFHEPIDAVDAAPATTDVAGTRFNLIKVLSVLGVLGAIPIFLLLPSTRSRPATGRTLCLNNVKNITLALHSYAAEYETLPPAYTVDSEGDPLHSWRTLILPYLDQQQLYETIDFAKPWDDPVNAAAGREMHRVYRCASADIPAGYTTYLANASPNGCFHAIEPRDTSAVMDGTSNTLMVIEVSPDQAVHWMKPQDDDGQFFLNFCGSTALPHAGGIVAGFADGSVRFLAAETTQEERRAMISTAGSDSAAADPLEQ